MHGNKNRPQELPAAYKQYIMNAPSDQSSLLEIVPECHQKLRVII